MFLRKATDELDVITEFMLAGGKDLMEPNAERQLFKEWTGRDNAGDRGRAVSIADLADEAESAQDRAAEAA